jgi:serine protease inhibitor
MSVGREWFRRLFNDQEKPSPGSVLPHASTRPSGSTSFGDDNNDFSLAMYELLRQRPGNIFFSPFSLRTALGMAHAGASGETSTQMRQALRLSPSDENLHIAFAEIIQRLNAAGGMDGLTVD